MENKKYTFVELLKKYTTIDVKFIDAFLDKFKVNNELEFDIKDDKVAKYLNITLRHLRDRLCNRYTSKNEYIQNVDFVKIADKKNNKKTYWLNYKCFERIAMTGTTDEALQVRLYFSKLREFIYEHNVLIFQALDNNNDLRKYAGFETIYFFAVDESNSDEIFKVGRTSNIKNRLKTYNVGRIRDVDLKYLAIVKNANLIELCIKHKLAKKELIPNREIYCVNSAALKKIIDKCYCKNVTAKENEEFYEEIRNLDGFYGYIRDKVRIKPYVIIDKNISI